MPSDDPLEDHVLPIYDARATVIGTGTVVGTGCVLTALHVVDPEPTHLLRVGNRLSVAGIVSLPLCHYGAQRGLALTSYHRDRMLIGDDLGTVDLALLAIRGLRRTALPLRPDPIQDGERISVPCYPGGQFAVAVGPVVSHDDANFVAAVALSPGDSGAPAVDRAGCLGGLAVVEVEDQGVIFVGPALLAAFVRRTMPTLTHFLNDRNG